MNKAIRQETNRGPGRARRFTRPALRSIQNDLTFDRLEPRALLAGLPTLIDIVAGGAASSPENFTNVNGTLFFVANTGTSGKELWKSDGTVGAPIRIRMNSPT